jgi:hypothetical protein
MSKNLVVIASVGALAFGLAGTVSPTLAQASVAHPEGVTRANLPMPDGTPIIRDSGARLGCVHPGHLRLWNPAAPPTVRDSVAQADPPTVRDLVDQNAPPTIRDAKARPGGAHCVKLTNPGPTPIIRDSTAKLGDPDDGGQVTQAAARLSDPDDGGQVTQAAARLSDPDDGGQ